MSEKILVTGAKGQLGSELKNLAGSYPNLEFFFTDVDELDICQLNDVEQFVAQHTIDYLINCAAYTNVDKAEEEQDLANKINAIAVKNLVKVSEKHNIKLIHISTDYVFDGKAYLPLKETDKTNPIGVYGKTKLKGEEYIFASNLVYAIIRTSWLYSSYGNNFVKTIKKLASERNELKIISDQVGTPTYAKDLAESILELLHKLNNENKGIYHYSNEGVASWYDFAKEIISLLKIECKIKPIESKDYKTLADRPYYSVLNKSKIKNTFEIEIPYWKESLSKSLEKL